MWDFVLIRFDKLVPQYPQDHLKKRQKQEEAREIQYVQINREREGWEEEVYLKSVMRRPNEHHCDLMQRLIECSCGSVRVKSLCFFFHVSVQCFGCFSSLSVCCMLISLVLCLAQHNWREVFCVHQRFEVCFTGVG